MRPTDGPRAQIASGVGIWILRLKSMCCTDWCTALVLRISISNKPNTLVSITISITIITIIIRSSSARTRTLNRALAQILLSNIPARLEQEPAPARPARAEAARDARELGTGDVVEHDDVCACGERLVCFGLRADLDVEQEGEAAGGAGTLDGGGY